LLGHGRGFRGGHTDRLAHAQVGTERKGRRDIGGRGWGGDTGHKLTRETSIGLEGAGAEGEQERGELKRKGGCWHRYRRECWERQRHSEQGQRGGRRKKQSGRELTESRNERLTDTDTDTDTDMEDLGVVGTGMLRDLRSRGRMV
jgi:hypothetical protein